MVIEMLASTCTDLKQCLKVIVIMLMGSKTERS